MINKQFLKDHSSTLTLGTQINVNHEGCSAGVDSKKRLYIKRVVGGVIGYCHHCRDHGFWRELSTDGTLLRKWLMGKSTDHPVIDRESYTDYDVGGNDIDSVRILNWLHKYYINPVTSNLDNRYFRQKGSALFIPLHSTSGKTYGYQLRHFNLGDSKYTTHYTKNVPDDVSWFFNTAPKEERVLYITEDYTSAYRIWRDTEHQSLALLKTSISNYTIGMIRKLHYKTIRIWLDPDEPGIVASKKIIERLRYCLDDVNISQKTRIDVPEPKVFTVELLRRFCGL